MRLAIVLATAAVLAVGGPARGDDPLRIICFGAHPDDCELKAGGVAALWSAKGHKVKFVSVTNGDIGHWKMDKTELAKRRKEEVEACAKILGIETEVLDIHVAKQRNGREGHARAHFDAPSSGLR